MYDFLQYSSDNLPYEKIGNEVRCIAEEVPFDMPNSWEIVRLKNICILSDGDKLQNVEYPILDAKFLRGKSDGTVVTSGKFVPKGSTIILVDGENSGEVFIAPINGYLGSTFKILKITNEINIDYILKFIENNKVYLKNSKKGAAIPHLNKDLFFNLILGLPPIEEQKRIVAKIEDLLPLVKEYDVAYEKIEKLNNNFPEQLKKSILQEAVQGKLVPQNPKDEPASVLIERIREEKQKLIQEKKIKKDKNESYIFRRDNSHYEKIGNEERCIDDEIPFDIPDSWEWVRLNSIVELITKGSSPKWQGINYVENNGILFLTSENVGSFSLLLNKKKFVETKFNDLSPRSILKKNDFLMNIVGASIGRTALFNIEETNANINQATCIIRIIEKYKSVELLNYLLIFFNSSICYSYMCNNLVDCARANLSMSNIANFLIPLPPLAEQQRIVEKIEQLLPEIKTLQK